MICINTHSLMVATLFGVLSAGCSGSNWQPEVCADGTRCPTGFRCATAQNVCVGTSCGNGITEHSKNEACDDGNIESGDGCSALCRFEYCGNAIVDPGEACDDGNHLSMDGCRSDCLSTERCGNNIVDTALGEVCDDGNRDDGDFCTSVCQDANCTDGIWNANESDTDCGGQCSNSCWIAQSCNVDSDCTNRMCLNGTCAARKLVASFGHTCALLATGTVRCWGRNSSGQLGYGHTNNIGDDEVPATAGDVDIGGSVIQLAAGDRHTCALLDTGAVRCWGYGRDGSLGYGNENHIGDNETPTTAGDVNVGGSVVQLVAGNRHTCALLTTGAVRCWGEGSDGVLGYGYDDCIGDDEVPATAGDVDIGGSVIQLAAGENHTCSLLDTGAVRCWGVGEHGQLGYGNEEYIGDDEVPATAGDVDVGGSVIQLAAGGYHTCALLDTGAVRCWGYGSRGQLGYGNPNRIGDDEVPATAGDVDVGGSVIQLTAGAIHTCALLETGVVRCWGWGAYGQLGYANTNNIGEHNAPATAGDVDIGGPVIQLIAGDYHTCVVLETGAVRCWGHGIHGQLGYANTDSIGDNEDPSAAGDVNVGAPLI